MRNVLPSPGPLNQATHDNHKGRRAPVGSLRGEPPHKLCQSSITINLKIDEFLQEINVVAQEKDETMLSGY